MNDGPLTVGFHVGDGSQTRTQMMPNGLSAEWEAGDELALWARNSSGSYTLSNQIFKTYGLDGQRGFFTSTLDSAMPEDTYTYYCCYPAPVSLSGTKVTFDVPAVQDGKASGGADIMIATPVQHGALTPVPEPEDHSGMSMTMNRMMHQFRFYIPADNAVIGDETITRIVLSFPRNVTGKATMDLTDPTSAPVLSEGGSKITINLSDPLQASTAQDTYYACMVMNPTAFDAGESLRVQAYTSSMIAQVDPIDLCARDFQAGHSTPVKLKITAITDYPYSLSFKVAANNLGENPNSITLTAPNGCVWTDEGSNVYTYSPGSQIEVGQQIVFRFEDEAAYRAFSGKSISVTYDSDNALMYQTVTVPDLSGTNAGNVSLTVPYLFYEDFSGIQSFSDGHDNPTVIKVKSWSDFKNLVTGLGNVSDTYVGITDLSSYALDGWYGTRVAGQSGTSVRICCRYEHVALAGAYYKGRIYSPFMSGIKDGKDVKISVSFRYGAARNELDPGIFGDPADKLPLMYFGINTQETITNPDEIEGDIIDSITGLYGGSGYASNNVTSLSPLAIKAEKMSQLNGSYTAFTGTRTVTIDNVDNAMRLAWILSTDNSKSNVHANYWLYIDDIKVQIAK